VTRFIHDQFAKDYLEELLTPYGEVKAPRRVSGEMREIDVWFAPDSERANNLHTLGFLGRIAQTPILIEPFRNAASPNEICDCLLKLLEVRGELRREANRNQLKLSPAEIPKLWILTPTASATLLEDFLRQVRFGSVDEELAAIVEPLLALSPEEFTPMLLQLSREELLARFRGV